MALEDFEKELAEQKEAEKRRKSRHDNDKPSSRHHKHHHKSSRRHDAHYDDDDTDRHRSKRSRYSPEDDPSSHRHRHRHRHRGEDGSEKRHRRTEDDASDRSHRRREPSEIRSTQRFEEGASTRPETSQMKRDSWMEAPSALDIDYVQKKKSEAQPPKTNSLAADFELKIHKKELNHHLRDLQDGDSAEEMDQPSVLKEVDYTFGDAGSQWRMTKLNAVYRKAKETGGKVEDIALERYDSLREFDEAREEEMELERRRAYGQDYVGKIKPSGDLYQERKLDAGIHSPHARERKSSPHEMVSEIAVSTATQPKIDQTALNKLRAQMMKAQLKKDPKLADLEVEYAAAVETFNQQSQDPTVITLSAMDNRMLSSAPRNEVKSVTNRRGAERGQVEENEDMSIADMVAEERRTKYQRGGEGARLAERIAKDGKFTNDLEYMDENANQLAKRVHKSDMNLRNVAIGEYQKMQKILENCPLCHHEDTETPPIAPVVSLATRTYLTLPTEPELSSCSAMVVPTAHHVNLLECDDDEWEEIRNFMKSLTRFYHDQGRDVVFYENAAFPHRKPHAALVAVPLPYSLGETAPAFFKEAFLTTEGDWSQHKKIIDTLAKSKQGLGGQAFRKTLVKEMPYFHVWFELDGGIGHVVEDSDKWPRGDLFAREIVGGMLGSEPDVIKRQGRWQKGKDARVDGFRKKWKKFDWTRVLTEEA